MVDVKESNFPLISVIVITYNSSKYVIETLESIKSQSYNRIELIISDDCSADNTVDICREWCAENKFRFEAVDLITSERNSGIPGNCNRGFNASHGEWLKFIAGDDLLDSLGIEKYFVFHLMNRNAAVIISRFQVFSSDTLETNPDIKPPQEFIPFFDLSSIEQLNVLRFKFEGLVLGLFLKRSTLIGINGFDENFRLLDDLPLLLRLLDSGNKFYFLPEVTTYYRRYASLVSKPNSKYYKSLLNEMFHAYKTLRRPYLNGLKKLHNDLIFLNEYIMTYLFHSNNSRMAVFVTSAVMQLSPIHHKYRKEIRQRNKLNH
jgi:glycosyltransferase involved in cell wall biosynthesis